jgi:Protein of unknown function (DUF1822)
MNTTIDELAVIYPDQLLLEISQDEEKKAWQQSQRDRLSNAAACRNAYLNRLCLNSFLSYLDEAEISEKPAILPSLESLPSIWETVNGTALQIGQMRLILIPSEQSCLSEFRVPREWVDIPHWAGNYYLAVEVNLESGWLQVWGYATYEQLRQGTCDRSDETYSIEAEELIEDISILWVAKELYPSQKPQVKPLNSLNHSQASTLVELLGKPTPYSPRLEVPFAQWMALIANDMYRQKLYQRRLEAVVATEASHHTSINLAHWFGSVFEAGWQSLEGLLNDYSGNLAYEMRFRQGSNLREIRQVVVEGVKLIDLGVQLGNQAVALLVGLTQEADNKVGIRVQLYPANEQAYLPHKIELALLAASGEAVQESQARIQDNMIQLKRFTCPVGTSFSVRVSLDRFSITEDFQIQ